MRTATGILLLIGGVVFPIAMLLWFNSRLRRQPELQPRLAGMLLALNGVLPVTLILAGLGLISAQFGAALGFKAALGASGLAVAVLLVGLWRATRANHWTGGHRDG